MAFVSEKKVRWEDAEWGKLLYSPFDRDFQQAMKDLVPDDEREWKGPKGCWWISDAFVDDVDMLAMNHFDGYIGLSR